MSRATETAPCRQKGYKAAHKQRTIPGLSSSYVIQAESFARVVEEQILVHDRLAASQRNDENGGLELICQRAAAMFGKTSKKYIRRLYDVRQGRVRSVQAEFVDEVLLACNLHLHRECDLLALPAGINAARDHIEAHLDEREMSPKIITELARDFLEFSYMVIHDTQEAKETQQLAELTPALTQLALEVAA